MDTEDDKNPGTENTLIPPDDTDTAEIEMKAIFKKMKEIVNRCKQENERVDKLIQKSKDLINHSHTLMAAIDTILEKSDCIIKECKKCGAKYRPSQWLELPFVGYQNLDEFDIKSELRDCPCSNTLHLVTHKPRKVA